ncbi:phosphoribosylformylglycinamidine synthase subunit PurL [Halobacteriales archaeon SW_5_70_135]|nr:MAG: phosphoribosylformylglycinamidine synthase subunit PurL [Halobacteriales archaeon SW_5_70_135]
MTLREGDRRRIERALGREPTRAEAALFENLWSEHCAYRSSRALLSAFESDGEHIVLGPGDDAAVVAVPAPDDLDATTGVGDGECDGDETYLALGVESHNHPSFVDPYDGAATGVGGIVRDVISMGAYPVALTDSLYFGPLERERSRYLMDGVVEGIADYGNAVGVPTVGGSVDFHDSYVGNPLVNVGCVGLLDEERLVTARAREPGNRLVLVGNATGRDGLGGAAFASEDLDDDSETEDRPAVQVGDPYTEKLLIETSETLTERDLVVAARDLGAAGLGGATCEMVAKGDLGADVDLDAVHRREPGMTATEVLLAESQERMCYEVRPEDVAAVRSVVERFEVGCSVVGSVTDDGRYVCRFDDERVVDAPAELLADGAPLDDHDRTAPPESTVDRPGADLEAAFEAVVGNPSTASEEWVYRQYDHEVGLRTTAPPGGDAAVLAVRETGDAESGTGIALSSGAAPDWTAAAPRQGARAVAIENATNLASVGARPLAAVDCLNGGNPERAETYGGFAAVVEGLAAACRDLGVPVVGGNVSLYNDSESGPVVPTPTLLMLGARDGWDAPGIAAVPDAEVVLVGATEPALGGSAYLAAFDGDDRFPSLPDPPAARVEAVADVADLSSTAFVHDVSQGGLATTLAETVTAADGTGLTASLPGDDPHRALFAEAPGRVVVGTTDPDAVRAAADGTPVTRIGETTADATLSVTAGSTRLRYDHETLRNLRSTIERAMDG